MATPAPKAKSRRKLILAIVAIAVIAVVVTPIALAGNYRVPVEIMSFDSTTGTTTTSNLRVTNEVVTAWEYYFSIRTQGMVRTSDSGSGTSSNGGTTNITLTMTLTNPSNQTIDLGKTNINGGIGGRTHSIYLSIDQGVRVNGSYRLDMTFTANVVLIGGLVEAPFTATYHSGFTLSGF